MKKFTRILFILCCLNIVFCAPTEAAFKPTKTFHLSDGTTIKGKIAGIRKRDGAYIIESTKVGTIAVHPNDVITMSSEGPAEPVIKTQEPATALTPTNIEQVKQTLLADPTVNRSIQELMADPEMLELLQDPELMKTITSMDPQAIKSNPKVQQLLANPKMQQLLQQAAQTMTAPQQ